MKPRQRRSNNFRTHRPHTLKTETRRSRKAQTHHQIRGKKEGKKKKKKNRTHDFFVATNASASDPKTKIEIKTLRPKLPLFSWSPRILQQPNPTVPAHLSFLTNSFSLFWFLFWLSSFFLSDFLFFFNLYVYLYLSVLYFQRRFDKRNRQSAADNPRGGGGSSSGRERKGREGARRRRWRSRLVAKHKAQVLNGSKNLDSGLQRVLRT